MADRKRTSSTTLGTSSGLPQKNRKLEMSNVDHLKNMNAERNKDKELKSRSVNLKLSPKKERNVALETPNKDDTSDYISNLTPKTLRQIIISSPQNNNNSCGSSRIGGHNSVKSTANLAMNNTKKPMKKHHSNGGGTFKKNAETLTEFNDRKNVEVVSIGNDESTDIAELEVERKETNIASTRRKKTKKHKNKHKHLKKEKNAIKGPLSSKIRTTAPVTSSNANTHTKLPPKKTGRLAEKFGTVKTTNDGSDVKRSKKRRLSHLGAKHKSSNREVKKHKSSSEKNVRMRQSSDVSILNASNNCSTKDQKSYFLIENPSRGQQKIVGHVHKINSNTSYKFLTILREEPNIRERTVSCPVSRIRENKKRNGLAPFPIPIIIPSKAHSVRGQPSRSSNIQQILKAQQPGETQQNRTPSSSNTCSILLESGTRTLKDFHIFDQIGQGTYGTVFKAHDFQTNKVVALKKVYLEHELIGFPLTSVREITALRQLNHPNIVNLQDVITGKQDGSDNLTEKGCVYLVFEYMDHDLLGLIESRMFDFSQEINVSIMKQLLMGLNYCHKNKFLHRDIKCANIMMNNKGEVKLADFGFARRFNDRAPKRRYTNRVVTLWYRAPELLFGSERYSSSVDIWSCGCVLAELFLQRPLFESKDEVELLQIISKICGTPVPAVWPNVDKLPLFQTLKPKKVYPRRLREELALLPTPAVDLIDKMLILDPDQRITAENALKSLWLSNVDIAKLSKSLPKWQECHELWSRNSFLQSEQEEQKGVSISTGFGEGPSRQSAQITYDDYKFIGPGMDVPTILSNACMEPISDIDGSLIPWKMSKSKENENRSISTLLSCQDALQTANIKTEPNTAETTIKIETISLLDTEEEEDI